MPTDDYIKRSDALMAIQECFDKELEFSYDNAQSCMNRINSIPAADVALVRRGYWMSAPGKRARFCSVCCADEPYKFADADADVYGWCPHCGAKMGMEENKS